MTEQTKGQVDNLTKSCMLLGYAWGENWRRVGPILRGNAERNAQGENWRRVRPIGRGVSERNAQVRALEGSKNP
jgi:hypothetical protein